MKHVLEDLVRKLEQEQEEPSTLICIVTVPRKEGTYLMSSSGGNPEVLAASLLAWVEKYSESDPRLITHLLAQLMEKIKNGAIAEEETQKLMEKLKGGKSDT